MPSRSGALPGAPLADDTPLLDAAEESQESRAYQRQRLFMALRAAPLTVGGEAVPPAVFAAARIAPEALPAAGEASALGESFRTRLVAEYRYRLGQTAPAPAPAAFGLPEAPAPAPANNWTPIGPSVVCRGQASNRPPTSGRVAGIAVAPGGARVYVASANGGVWRSDDAGRTWRSTMEAWDLNPTHHASDSLACGAIAVDHADPDRVYVGTGEGNALFIQNGVVVGTAAYFGVGPVRSDDGGQNWMKEPTGPGDPGGLEGHAFYQLAVDPSDRERVVAATDVGLFRREPDGSGGFHWNRKRDSIFTSVIAARHPEGTVFFAAPWGAAPILSVGGDQWSALGSGFPQANVGRVGLAAQPDNPAAIYALVSHAGTDHVLGVWRLDPTDLQWRRLGGVPSGLFGPDPTRQGQGSYDLAISVDPRDANLVHLGGSTRAAGGQWSASLYRCTVRVTGSGATLSYFMVPVYVGGRAHADVHTLEFTPDNPDQLWLGCDGGLFFNADAPHSDAYEARNSGLATLTMNHLGVHPTEDAVLFCGSQDNGTLRYTGDEAWLHSAAGDGGYAVVNWHDPYRVLRTYVAVALERTDDGGADYSSWAQQINIPDKALFYAPLAGTPVNPERPADAELVAFGGLRPWISEDFGDSWHSLPADDSSDALSDFIWSLAFASGDRLYAGLFRNGQIYRFDRGANGWTRTRLDFVGPNRPPIGPVTCIAVDPADSTGSAIYVTYGGIGDYHHVWHFDGAQWEARSGPEASPEQCLLDVQHSAIVADPENPATLYAGADIGVWHSTDAGQTWAPFSSGLPDAAVLDLRLHPARRLLWASTHGRGIYEYALDATAGAAVELYVRDTLLDRGRRPTEDEKDDPTQRGAAVRHTRGPGIKVDPPDPGGGYQTPSAAIDFYQFTNEVEDRSDRVRTSAGPAVVNRAYVQVHNRGVDAADAQVMLLIATASPAVPALPGGYDAEVRLGNWTQAQDWKLVGVRSLQNVRAGAPLVASFDLSSAMLPAPNQLPGHAALCLLALLHCLGRDEFTSNGTDVDALCLQDRKACMKLIRAVS